MHTRTERREDADAPVADLVPEALHHDGAVVWHYPCRRPLGVQVPQHVHGSSSIEAVVPLQPLDKLSSRPSRLGRPSAPRFSALIFRWQWLARPVDACRGRFDAPGRDGCALGFGIELHQVGLKVGRQFVGDGADEGAHGSAQFQGAAGAVAVPERHLAGLAGRRRDHHAVEGDLCDPPCGRAQQERLAHPRLVHHFFVKLAHPRSIGGEHRVQTPVGDGAGVGDRQAARALSGSQHPGGAVPHDARAQLPEFLGGIAARQQVQHRAEHLFADPLVGRCPAHHCQQIVERPVVDSDHGHDLLGQHVDGLARVADLLDLAGAHALRHHRRLHQIATMAREDLAHARLAHLMPGPADALHGRRHRRGRCHLDHQVDRAHVDAQFQRRRGHDGAHPSRLQVIFNSQPLLTAEGTVVRPDQFGALGRRGAFRFCSAVQAIKVQLVQPRRQPLREPPSIHKDDRGPMRVHQLQQPRMNRRPDAVRVRLCRRLCFGGRRAEVVVVIDSDAAVRRSDGTRNGKVAHVGHADDDLHIELLGHADIGDLDLTLSRTLRIVAAQEPRHLRQWPLRGRQPDALRRCTRGLAGQLAQPLQRQRQMRAPLGGRD